MLDKLHRFHGLGSVRKTYARGKNLRSGVLSLKYEDGRGNGPFKVAVVVSKKVNKSAVVRNRIRRRIYEAVRTNAQQPQPGTNLVFTVYGEQLATMPSAELQQLINELLSKTK